MRPRIVMVGAALFFTTSCGLAPEPTDARVLSLYVRSWYGAIRVERLSPPVASRIAAYSATALYGGMAAARSDLPSVDGVLNGVPVLPRADRSAAVDETITAVEAERVTLDSLLAEALPTTRSALARLADSLVADRMAAGVTDAVRDRSAELGRRIGLLIVEWSHTDGFDGTRGRVYRAPVGAGLWINDAPGNTYATQSLSGASEFVALDNPANLLRPGDASDRALVLSRPKRAGLRALPASNISGATEPYWGEVRPFVLKRWDSCPVPLPPTYSTAPGSDLMENARAVRVARDSLTAEQRTIALYWADNAGESGTPVGHWLSIAGQLVAERRMESGEAARMLLATAVSQADAFVAAWGYKYQFNLIRPRTYIRRVIDPSWEPLIPTPPFPEHPAGHSTQSAAAAATIAAFVGDTAFEDRTSISLGHAARRFPSIRSAADEAGMSRVYGGLHFPSGDLAGRALGACVAAAVIERFPVTPRK